MLLIDVSTYVKPVAQAHVRGTASSSAQIKRTACHSCRKKPTIVMNALLHGCLSRKELWFQKKQALGCNSAVELLVCFGGLEMGRRGNGKSWSCDRLVRMRPEIR